MQDDAVADSTGGAIEGVGVSLTADGEAGAPVSAVASVNSKADGSYSLTIPAGRYRVRFARSMFVSVERVVVNPKYSSLFSDEEKSVARGRLAALEISN